MSRTNPIVFAVGCARSGTTLLQRMLDNHPELAVANDTHFILGCVPRGILAHGADPAMTNEILEDTLAYYRFARLGLDEAETRAAAAAADTYTGFVSNLYSTFAAKHDKPYAGEKTPSYATSIPILHRLFPDAKFVFLVRDGRDVVLSVLDWAVRKGRRRGPAKHELWDEDPLAAASTWWRWNVHLGLDGARMVGDDKVLRLRHADLVADPDGCMQRVCRLLKLEYSDAMSRFYEGKERMGGNGSAKKRWLRPTAGLRDWRTQMAPEDQAVFNALAGDVLETLGYDPGHTTMTSAAIRRVESARRSMERDTRWLLPVEEA